MSEINAKPRTRVKPKTERPRLHKVILVNDDFTPREFVVTVLKGEFRLSEDQAYRVMMTARKGVCVPSADVHQGRRGEQGDPRHRRRPGQGLPTAVHHGAGGVAVRQGLGGGALDRIVSMVNSAGNGSPSRIARRADRDTPIAGGGEQSPPLIAPSRDVGDDLAGMVFRSP